MRTLYLYFERRLQNIIRADYFKYFIRFVLINSFLSQNYSLKIINKFLEINVKNKRFSLRKETKKKKKKKKKRNSFIKYSF